MKRAICAAALALAAPSAFAADSLILRPSYQPEANPWSRPYVGVSVGLGAGAFVYGYEAGGTSIGEITLPGSGIEGSLRVGYDHVVSGNILIGVVADYARTGIWSGGELTISGSPPWTGSIKETLTSLATIRGRVGFTDRNNLFYAHGGVAIGTAEVTVNGDAIPGIIENPRIGFAVGAGVEYAISEHASIQTEYSYVDLGQFDIYAYDVHTVSDHLAFHRLTTGLNLRF